MYAQNTVNVKSSFPRSWKCSAPRPGTSPDRRSAAATIARKGRNRATREGVDPEDRRVPSGERHQPVEGGEGVRDRERDQEGAAEASQARRRGPGPRPRPGGATAAGTRAQGRTRPRSRRRRARRRRAHWVAGSPRPAPPRGASGVERTARTPPAGAQREEGQRRRRVLGDPAPTTTPHEPFMAVWIGANYGSRSASVRKKTKATSQAGRTCWLLRPKTTRSAVPRTAAPSSPRQARSGQTSPSRPHHSSRAAPALRRSSGVDAASKRGHGPRSTHSKPREAKTAWWWRGSRFRWTSEDGSRAPPHGELEGDGDVGGPREERLAVAAFGLRNRMHPLQEREAGGGAAHRHHEHDPRQPRAREAPSTGGGTGCARPTASSRRRAPTRRRGRHQGSRTPRGDRSVAQPRPPLPPGPEGFAAEAWCGSASGRTVLTSAIATMGSEAHKQAEEREEETEAAHEGDAMSTRRGREVAPAGGQEVAVEPVTMITNRSNHMPDVDQIAMTNMTAGSCGLLEPEELRHDDVAGDHDPVGPGVGARGRFMNANTSYGLPLYQAMKNSMSRRHQPVARMILPCCRCAAP